MTRGAALISRRCKVHRSRRRRNLSAARESGSDRVAARAIHILRAAVPGVAEINLKSPGVFADRRGRSARLVTSSARADILFADFGVRAVTLETIRVRVSALRNRKRRAAIRRFMTSRAARLPLMASVVEPGIKGFQSGKTLDARRRVADVTHRMLIARVKLFRVTARTRRVTGHSHRRRIAFAFVTEQAGKPCVLGIRVLKSGIILTCAFNFKFRFLNRSAFKIIVSLRTVNKKESENEASGGENQKPEPEPQVCRASSILRIVFGRFVHNSIYLISPKRLSYAIRESAICRNVRGI